MRYPFCCFHTFTVAVVLLSLIIHFQPSAGAADTQPQVFASQPPGTSASADILIEASSGTVLHEKNADKHMGIASTTKILTAIVVLETCDVNDKVVIKHDFPTVEGSSIYLKHGEELTVLELLYGLLLESGNDAAVALALHVSGSLEAFADLMNDYAKNIGCRHSQFKNPHGLDHEGQYSTARDLSLISAAAMRNKTFHDIVSTKHVSVGGRYFRNHNKLLWNCPGAIGIKTGFTKSAGRSLVSCTERDGMRLICVTLSAPDDWNDHTKLYDWAYRSFGCLNVTTGEKSYGSIPVVSGLKETIPVIPAEDFIYVYDRSDETELSWELPRFVYAPVTCHEVAGVITIKRNGETLKEIPLVFGESVALDESVPLTFLEKLKWSIFSRKQQACHYGYYLN